MWDDIRRRRWVLFTFGAEVDDARTGSMLNYYCQKVERSLAVNVAG